MCVLDEVAVEMLVTACTLAVDVEFVVAEVRVRPNGIKMTGVILTLKGSATRDARLTSVTQSDELVEYLLQFLLPLGKRLEPLLTFLDFRKFDFLFLG